MPDLENKEPTFISILGRAFQILEQLLTSDEPMGVSQLSRETGIPKANTFRIVKTLEELKAIEAEGDGYILGSKMIELGNGAKRNNQFSAIAIPHLQALSAASGETVNLGLPFRDCILVIHTELSEQSHLVASLQPIMPLYCSSIGKLFLSHMPEKDQKLYFDSDVIRARTVNTITTYRAFLPERDEILATGLAHDREEYDYGLSCVAAPVTRNGELAAGISLSGPTSRLNYKGLDQLEAELRKTAALISDEITAANAVIPDLN